MPEIVLQPIWRWPTLCFKICSGIFASSSEAGAIGDFDAADFTLALLHHGTWQARPPLVTRRMRWPYCTSARREQRTPEALPRLIAFLTVAAAYRLGLENGLALAFGDVVAYLLAGIPAP